MPALIHLREFNPLVGLRVVELRPLRRLVDILPGAGHHDEGLAQRAAGMPVARVPHALTSF